MTRTTLVAVAAVWYVAGMHAQVRVVRTGDDRLTGIHAVDVLVTVSGANSDGCAIHSAPLESLAVQEMRAAAVEATVSTKARSWFYSVTVDVRPQRVAGSCAVAITTELVAQVDGIPEADRYGSPGSWGSLLVGVMPLLRETALIAPAPGKRQAAVETAVRGHVAAFAAKLRAANP
jgi:hypothetical protein